MKTHLKESYRLKALLKKTKFGKMCERDDRQLKVTIAFL